MKWKKLRYKILNLELVFLDIYSIELEFKYYELSFIEMDNNGKMVIPCARINLSTKFKI